LEIDRDTKREKEPIQLKVMIKCKIVSCVCSYSQLTQANTLDTDTDTYAHTYMYTIHCFALDIN